MDSNRLKCDLFCDNSVAWRVRSLLHSQTGMTVGDWSATTELKDTGTPFRYKLCVTRERERKPRLSQSSCHHLDSSNGKQAQTICFSFAHNYFCSPTHTHSARRRWHTSGEQLQWTEDSVSGPSFSRTLHGNTSSCADVQLDQICTAANTVYRHLTGLIPEAKWHKS